MERVGQGCIILQSMVNKPSGCQSHIPNNIPIEAKAGHKTLAGLFMWLCCTPVNSDTQVNKYMHADTKRDSLGCPVVR